MDSLPARIRALKQEHRDHGPDDADTCNGNPCICGASAQHAEIEAVAREVEHAERALAEERRGAAELVEVAGAFEDVAMRAVAHHRAPKTGMQVPYHDDFANVTPSVVARLDWWARRFRDALAAHRARRGGAKED